MSPRYFQVYISAPDKKQADKILDALLKKHLVSGGLVTNGPSRFWWKGKIAEENYYNISAFTRENRKEEIIDEVRKIATDEVPMVWFLGIDGNPEFLEWIDDSVN